MKGDAVQASELGVSVVGGDAQLKDPQPFPIVNEGKGLDGGGRLLLLLMMLTC